MSRKRRHPLLIHAAIYNRCERFKGDCGLCEDCAQETPGCLADITRAWLELDQLEDKFNEWCDYQISQVGE